jgi:cysteine desulfurase
MSTNNSIYLDNNATTPVDQLVLQKMLPYFSEHFGNASSKTHPYGWVAEGAVKEARMQVASLIKCEEQEIVFTSGATEAINLAIKGVCKRYSEKGKHLITASTEHKAVLDVCEQLQKEGYEITYLSVGRDGLIDADELKKSLRDDTVLVAIMMVNNETGVMQDMKKIADIVHEKGSLLFSDTTQAIGKIALDTNIDRVDLLCMSAHKMYGPKGVGALYVRRKNPRVSLLPLIEGGGQERGLRSGTLNVTGIVGLGAACELAQKEMWENASLISKTRTAFEQQVCDLPGTYVNGSIKNRLYNVSNICFGSIKADELILKAREVAFATGSACTSAEMHPSHVLTAMGLNKQEAMASARFSFGKYITMEQANAAAKTIINAVEYLRKSSKNLQS